MKPGSTHIPRPLRIKRSVKVPLSSPLDVALQRVADYVKEGTGGIEELRNKHVMLAEGMRDRAIPPERAITDFRTLFPKGPVVELENVGHFCQEDAPETLVALVRQFIQMT